MRHLPAILIAVGFLCLGVVYAANTPTFEAPDEAAHFIYIHGLVETGSLPLIEDRDTMFEQMTVESHQPPLYYLLAAPLITPFDRRDLGELTRRNPFASVGMVTGANENVLLHPLETDGQTRAAVWVVRLFSLALATATLFTVYAVGRLVGGTSTGLTSMLLVASLPTFVHISASINNDNLVNLTYALGIYLCLRTWTHRRISAVDLVALSLVLAAAAISKTTGLSLMGVAILSHLIGALTGRFSWRRVLTLYGAILVAFALLAAWWYVRNWRLYGDPLAFEVTMWVWSRGAPTWPSLFELRGIWESFWMVLGHLNVPGPSWLVPYASLISLAGFLGAVMVFVRGPEKRWRILFLLGVCLVVTASLISATRRINVSQGRLLYPALAAFAPLVVMGWEAVLRRFSPLVVAPLATAALIAPFGALAPSYAPLQAVDELPQRLIHLDAVAETLPVYGYTLNQERIASDGAVSLDLYIGGTHPENPALFVTARHPVTGETVGSVDTYPGMAPTDSLDPDTIYRVPVRVPIGDAPVAVPYQIELAFGWRVPDEDDPGAGRFLSWEDVDGREISAVFGAGPVMMADQAPEPVQYSVDVVFGDVLRLRGYSIESGEQLTVHTQWEALRQPAHDWTLTVGLVNEANALLEQFDAPPEGLPATAWQPGVIWTSSRTLPDPGEAYRLRIGWYRLDTLERLALPNTQDNLYYSPPLE